MCCGDVLSILTLVDRVPTPRGAVLARVEIPQGVMWMYVEKYEQHTISKEIIDLKLGNVSHKLLLLFFYVQKCLLSILTFFIIYI